MNDYTGRETEIFEHARALSPDQQLDYLDVACGSNARLRATVERMLRAHDQAVQAPEPSTAKASPATAQPPALDEPSADDWPTGMPRPMIPGQRIGRYKLLKELGEGGCGKVFLAEQQEPVRRRVAFKIIKLGMDTAELIARFEVERQALAMMDHPNIAQVYDAGATEAGRPYFVMEFVHGVPITQFCDEKKLSITERLQLFIQVCQAIQHAHQKSIIHRDIKPSNVMVAMLDGVPTPKVIDFGIAKATGGRLTNNTFYTAFEQFIGTPMYMSPEQAATSGLDVDTRSDIYSLGVLLYELLTGQTPLDPKVLQDAGVDELRRHIREEEPAKPSARLGTLDDATLTATARHQNTEPPKLVSGIRGDLDWIVMKCLEKDRARRYETVNALVMDLRRHLQNEPVLARPPSAGYYLQKMARRHRAAFATVALVAVALVLGIVTTTWEAIRATQASLAATEARATADQSLARETQMRKDAEALAEKERRKLYADDMGAVARAIANPVGSLSTAQGLLADWAKSKPDLRGWEWYYLNGLTHRELLTLHTNRPEVSINSVAAWSPNGDRLAGVSGSDNTVTIWSALTGREMIKLQGHPGSGAAVAWSPDGKELAFDGVDNTLMVWNIESDQIVTQCRGHTGRIDSVAWSLDGKKLASGATDHTTKIWDAATGAEICSVVSPSAIRSVSWNNSGTQLASASSPSVEMMSRIDGVQILDAATGKILRTLKGDRAVAWSPDDQWLAAAVNDGSGTIRIYAAASGALTKTLPQPTSADVQSLAWSPDGHQLAAGSSGDYAVRIWDVATRQTTQVFRGHTDMVSSVAWRPDGTQIASGSGSAGGSETIKIWDVNSVDPHAALPVYPADNSYNWHSLAWEPGDQRLAIGGANGQVQLWNMDGVGKPEALATGNTDANGHTTRAAWNPAGTWLATSGEGAIKLWDTTRAPAREIWNLPAYTKNGAAISAFSWLAWSPDGKKLATLSAPPDPQPLKVWDPANQSLLSSFSVPPTATFFTGLSWSPDGRKLVFSNPSRLTMVILDASTGKVLRTIPAQGNNGIEQAPMWSPDGKRLAFGCTDGTIKIWDMETNTDQPALILRGHTGGVRCVTWSPDGKRLATGSAGSIGIWDAASGEEVCFLEGEHAQQVCALAWSADGLNLVSADMAGQIIVHDATTGHAASGDPQAQTAMASRTAAKKNKPAPVSSTPDVVP